MNMRKPDVRLKSGYKVLKKNCCIVLAAFNGSAKIGPTLVNFNHTRMHKCLIFEIFKYKT